MDIPLFSTDALAIMGRQLADRSAKSFYDLMSGSLIWSDEFPSLTAREKSMVLKDWTFRYLLAYRVSLTLAAPRREFEPVWQQVSTHAAGLPGLLSERRGDKALHRLLAGQRRAYQTTLADSISD